MTVELADQVHRAVEAAREQLNNCPIAKGQPGEIGIHVHLGTRSIVVMAPQMAAVFVRIESETAA